MYDFDYSSLNNDEYFVVLALLAKANGRRPVGRPRTR